MYIAMAVALVVWAGIFLYLWRLDAMARELRRRLDNHPDQAPPPVPTATLERRTASDEQQAAP
jgi:CcmD family protein